MKSNIDIFNFLNTKYEEHEYKNIILLEDFADAFLGTFKKNGMLIAAYDLKKVLEIICEMYFKEKTEDSYIKSAKFFYNEIIKNEDNYPIFITTY